MKKIISILLLLCMLAGICGAATAEGTVDSLDFPKSGLTFKVPDYVKDMVGGIFSISDYGETSYKSGIIYAYALYLPRSDEETAALQAQLIPYMGMNEEDIPAEVMQAYTDYMAPRTELFIVIGLRADKNWENDVSKEEGIDKLREPVKIGDCDGFTYYLTALKPEVVSERMGLVSQEVQDAFIDVTNKIMEQPELITLKERDKSGQPPEPGTQIAFEATDLDGNTVTSAELTAGSKVTAITFWQTFCEPCKKEMPELDRLVSEYGDKGLNIVGCVCDASTESTLEKAKEIAGEHLFRNVKISADMLEKLPFTGTPTTYFLDGEGRVLDYPIASELPAEYIAALEDYLNGKTDEFQALLKQKVDGNETAEPVEEDQTYTVFFVDQNGDPIPEVAMAFCTADRCSNAISDEEGKCVYIGPACEYHVTIVEVPDGYSEDYNDDVYTEKYSCSVTVVITKE